MSPQEQKSVSEPSEPRNHHYVPQFYLRAFATDEGKNKVATLARSGDFAVWGERSISTIGYERDLYVHLNDGLPVSMETCINTNVETPISSSVTWEKISSGRSDLLDRSDKPILYSLIRHLEVRTPHFSDTILKLTAQAALPENRKAFSEEERRMYASIRENPNFGRMMSNVMASSVNWAMANYQGTGLSILRTNIPIYSSTIPVMAIPSPPDRRSRAIVQNAAQHQVLLPLNRNVSGN